MYCRGIDQQIEGCPLKYVEVEGQRLEVVDTFCYLGDTICAGGGVQQELLPTPEVCGESLESCFQY